MKFTYVIKDYTGNNFDNVFTSYGYEGKRYDHKSVAEEVAEEYWRRDPSDPSNFEATVGVRDETGLIKWFAVTAEPRVDFYAKELRASAEAGK